MLSWQRKYEYASCDRRKHIETIVEICIYSEDCVEKGLFWHGNTGGWEWTGKRNLLR